MSPRALVIDTAFVGDVVFTFAATARLAAAGFGVDLVVRAGLEPLAACGEGVGRVFGLDKRGAQHSPLSTLAFARALSRAGGDGRSPRRYDVVLGAHPSLRTALLALCIPADLRVGWRRLGYSEFVKRPYRFVDDRHALVDRVLCGRSARPDFGHGLPRLAIERLGERLNRTPSSVPAEAVALLPGSRFATKRWPLTRFRSLAAQLRDRGIATVAFGSAEERLEHGPLDVSLDARGWTLPETAAALSMCIAVVGGDSGLLHLGRAVGTPAVAIFGPTDPLRLPIDPGRLDLYRDDLKCRPCSPHGAACCPRGDHACLEGLEVGRVLSALRSLGVG